MTVRVMANWALGVLALQGVGKVKFLRYGTKTLKKS